MLGFLEKTISNLDIEYFYLNDQYEPSNDYEYIDDMAPPQAFFEKYPSIDASKKCRSTPDHIYIP